LDSRSKKTTHLSFFPIVRGEGTDEKKAAKKKNPRQDRPASERVSRCEEKELGKEGQRKHKEGAHVISGRSEGGNNQ